MMKQGFVTFGLAGLQCLFQGIKDEVGAHRTADVPDHDAPGKGGFRRCAA